MTRPGETELQRIYREMDERRAAERGELPPPPPETPPPDPPPPETPPPVIAAPPPDPPRQAPAGIPTVSDTALAALTAEAQRRAGVDVAAPAGGLGSLAGAMRGLARKAAGLTREKVIRAKAWLVEYFRFKGPHFRVHPWRLAVREESIKHRERGDPLPGTIMAVAEALMMGDPSKPSHRQRIITLGQIAAFTGFCVATVYKVIIWLEDHDFIDVGNSEVEVKNDPDKQRNGIFRGPNVYWLTMQNEAGLLWRLPSEDAGADAATADAPAVLTPLARMQRTIKRWAPYLGLAGRTMGFNITPLKARAPAPA